MIAGPESRYKTLEERLGYTFENPGLLQEALTHHTFVEEHPKLQRKDNQRLEFLGDAVIELVVRHRLLHAFTDTPKGTLDPTKQQMVSRENLARMAREDLAVGSMLDLGRGARLERSEENTKVLHQAFEAVVGAVFEDTDPATALAVVGHLFDAQIRAANLALAPVAAQ